MICGTRIHEYLRGEKNCLNLTCQILEILIVACFLINPLRPSLLPLKPSQVPQRPYEFLWGPPSSVRSPLSSLLYLSSFLRAKARQVFPWPSQLPQSPSLSPFEALSPTFVVFIISHHLQSCCPIITKLIYDTI